jgi:hypothetical protein
MKKLLFILPFFFSAFAVNAQGTQTEDEVYIGKGKTFGNYKGTGIIIPDFGRETKPTSGQTTITGMVVGICKKDCCNNKVTSCSIDLKKDDGSIVTVGTTDNGFTVPKKIKGHSIMIEGKDAGQISGGRKRRDIKKEYQQGIQFAATGIKIID